MRDFGSESTGTATGDFVDFNSACFANQRCYALSVEVHCCADGRVAGEGQLGDGCEDIEVAFGCWEVGVLRGGVDEDCFGEVEFFGDALFLRR